MNRDELFAAIARDTGYDDKGDYMQEWLTSAEFRINQLLRVDENVKRSITDLTESLITTPDDFLAPKQIKLLSGGPSPAIGVAAGELAYMPVGVFDSGEYEPQTNPTFYTNRGRVLEFISWTGTGPYQIDLRYYAELPPVTEVAPTNWMLTKAPHIYKDAMKFFVFQHTLEFDTANAHLQLMTQEITVLNDLAKRKLVESDAPLYMRPPRKMGGRYS